MNSDKEEQKDRKINIYMWNFQQQAQMFVKGYQILKMCSNLHVYWLNSSELKLNFKTYKIA